MGGGNAWETVIGLETHVQLRTSAWGCPVRSRCRTSRRSGSPYAPRSP